MNKMFTTQFFFLQAKFLPLPHRCKISPLRAKISKIVYYKGGTIINNNRDMGVCRADSPAGNETIWWYLPVSLLALLRIRSNVVLLQTPSDAPWTESPHIKVDDSSVLGYDALTRLEDWAANEAPLMFEFDFDQASLFSGFVHQSQELHIL